MTLLLQVGANLEVIRGLGVRVARNVQVVAAVDHLAHDGDGLRADHVPVPSRLDKTDVICRGSALRMQ